MSGSGDDAPTARAFLGGIWQAVGGPEVPDGRLRMIGAGTLPSAYPVSDLAAASVAATGLALAELIAARHGRAPEVMVDRRLASFWFGASLRPQGWSPPPVWDAVAGDYPAADGWIRLHTNAPHHRRAALAVLGVPAERERVARAVAARATGELETAIVAAGGVAGAMLSAEAWAAHPQGRAVAAEPLLHLEATEAGPAPGWAIPKERPLAGIRVLDLTRVLAGPAATRFLAGFGAEVLRLDPPHWDEPALEPEMTLGKRCARLDLRTAAGRETFEALLGRADVLVHGYRSDALERLGLGAGWRREVRPGLVDVALDAYGSTGPWRHRRGFDSIVQMSSGIAEAGMRRLGRDRPTPLPVQALDHATGYLLATAALRGLARRIAIGEGSSARASLARTAVLLAGRQGAAAPEFAPRSPADLAPGTEHTAWGPARRLVPPLSVEGAAMMWTLPAGRLGTSLPAWPD